MYSWTAFCSDFRWSCFQNLYPAKCQFVVPACPPSILKFKGDVIHLSCKSLKSWGIIQLFLGPSDLVQAGTRLALVVRCAEHKSHSLWTNRYVGSEEPAIAERVCSVVVQMLESDAVMDAVLITAAMESIWFVLQVNGPTPVHHFCRLFAKAGLVPQLLASLRSLCACSALTTSPQAQGHRYRNSHDFKSGAASPLVFFQCRNMGYVNPKIIYFHYLKSILSSWSKYPTNI